MSYRKKQFKGDRLTNPDDVGNRVNEAIWHAVGPVDILAREMENRWGADRLPQLVDPALAARFGEQKALLDEAIEIGDVQMVALQASAMMRAWKALDAAALQEGHATVSNECWIARGDDGEPFGVARTTESAVAAARMHEGKMTVYSLAEIARIVASFQEPLLKRTKEAFPDAEITDIRETFDFKKGDDVGL